MAKRSTSTTTLAPRAGRKNAAENRAAAARRTQHENTLALGKFVNIFASVFETGSAGGSAGGGRHGAAQSTRLRGDYNKAVGSGDYIGELDREPVVRFSRHMDMNSIHFPLFIDRFVDLVVGKGLMPRAPADTPAYRAVEMFHNWARRDADHRRLRSYQSLQRLWLREALIAGDCGRVRTNEGTIQTVESERIGARFRAPSDDNKDGYVTDGVEVDKEGRPKRYWISPWQWRSASVSGGMETAVDVRNMSLVAYRKRDSVRGMPLMANSLEAMARMEETHIAVNVSMKLAALLSLFIQSESPGAMRTSLKTGTETTTNSAGATTIKDTAALGPGGIAVLGVNEKVSSVQGAQPSTGYRDYEDLSMMLVSACAGMPVEIATLRVGNANFATMKMARILAEDAAEPIRNELIWQHGWVDYEWFVARQIASGALTGGMAQYMDKVSWTKPIIRLGDTLQEVKRRQLEVEQNFRSKDDIILEEYDGDPDQVREDRESEKRDEEERGIVPPSTPGSDTAPPAGGEGAHRRGAENAEEGKQGSEEAQASGAEAGYKRSRMGFGTK